MVKHVIGGHWVWSPSVQTLPQDNKIEAYVLPGGVIMQLMREVAAKRPGLITHVGLGTFADPRLGGGRLNAAATDDLVTLIEIDDREYLRYLPIPIDIAQNARKMVFVGTFDTKGAKSTTGGGILTIEANGSVQKLVNDVEQITFSGVQAVSRNQKVLYITERCVFELKPDGVHLIEVTPGIDIGTDILNRMAFRPVVNAPIQIMSSAHFTEHRQ